MGMPVAFFEVVSDDHERAQGFYAALFDWQVAADPDMGGYGLVNLAFSPSGPAKVKSQHCAANGNLLSQTTTRPGTLAGTVRR